MSYTYPATLAPDGDTILVELPDVPGAHSWGEDEADALGHAGDALETALMILMDERKPIPRPSPARGRPRVTLPPLSTAKVALYEAMRKAGMSKAALARRLGMHGPQVDRLLDLRHASRLDQLERALKLFGKRLVIEVRDAA
jgi:antitoxin HicB